MARAASAAAVWGQFPAGRNPMLDDQTTGGEVVDRRAPLPRRPLVDLTRLRQRTRREWQATPLPGRPIRGGGLRPETCGRATVEGWPNAQQVCLWLPPPDWPALPLRTPTTLDWSIAFHARPNRPGGERPARGGARRSPDSPPVVRSSSKGFRPAGNWPQTAAPDAALATLGPSAAPFWACAWCAPACA